MWTDGSGRNGNDFTYLQTFTSTDGGTVEILAGYGIANKCAFAGVYEFPKKVSYYKVETLSEGTYAQSYSR